MTFPQSPITAVLSHKLKLKTQNLPLSNRPGISSTKEESSDISILRMKNTKKKNTISNKTGRLSLEGQISSFEIPAQVKTRGPYREVTPKVTLILYRTLAYQQGQGEDREFSRKAIAFAGKVEVRANS